MKLYTFIYVYGDKNDFQTKNYELNNIFTTADLCQLQ